MSVRGSVLILGTRGVPAAHGGFETFAERFSLYLVERGWSVTVYCQMTDGDKITQDVWGGVRRVNIPERNTGALGTVVFDLKSILHALREPGTLLVLGYNTAIFGLLPRLQGRKILMNMDGIEWRRKKWSPPAKAWFYLNDWLGSLLSSRLIADHPAIEDHLATRRRRTDITMIPYGADDVSETPETSVVDMGLEPGRYFLSVGRIEPENSILEMVQAYVASNCSSAFVCVGGIAPEANPYHAAVLEAGAGRVRFVGGIYDRLALSALRRHALAYCHGHTVGGTNPSLVEALGAGNAVIAHDNKYNRWVAGDEQLYFSSPEDCAQAMRRVEGDESRKRDAQMAAHTRFTGSFQWRQIFEQYEALL